MKATLDHAGGGYVYHFGHEYDPDMLTIEVRMAKRFGRLWTTLSTYTSIAGAKVVPGTTLVLSDELWLNDASARARYAQRLRQAIPEPLSATGIDFNLVLEDVAHKMEVIQNEPVLADTIDITNLPPTRGYLMEPLLPENLPTMLYGAGGTGKSMLAVSIAVAVANGVPLLGWPTRQANVLYLDWETDRDDITQRAGAAARALGVAHGGFRYSRQSQPLIDLSARLVKRCREDDIGLVIIDSMGMAMDFNDSRDFSEAAIQMFRVMRDVNATVLCIDHIASEDMRHGKTGASKMYGSVYKWNSARNIYELRRSRDADHDGQHLMLMHRKTNVGPHQQEQYLRLQWDQGMARFEYETAPSAVAVTPPDAATILLLLSNGPLTDSAIASMLGEDEAAVHEVTRQMVLDGLVNGTAGGAIGLARTAPDDVQ